MQIENQTNEVRIDTSKIFRRSQTFMGLAILKFTTIIILIVVSIFILVDQNKSDNSGSSYDGWSLRIYYTYFSNFLCCKS